VDAWFTKALLGICFYEHGLDRMVRSGLSVTAYALTPGGAPSASALPVRARPNPEGVYVFHRLPALPGGTDPPGGGEMAFEVRDEGGRFLPAVYVTSDPFGDDDIFLTADAGTASPPGGAEPRFYIFPSPSRLISPRAAAVLRVQLWDRDAGRPAAWAVVEASHGGNTWYGLADHRGSALVAFHYPPVTASLAGSPPPASMAGLFELTWELEVRVRYLGDLEPLPGFGIPGLGEIAAQPYASIVAAKEGVPVDSVACPLVFGRETVLSTEGESVLWV